jgi:hypothetical protein
VVKLLLTDSGVRNGKVTGSSIEVVSEGHWKRFNPAS